MKRGFSNRIPYFILITYLVYLFTGFNMSAIQFVRLEVRLEFGMSNTLYATISSVSLVVSLLMSLVFTQVLDRIDIKLLMVTGIAVMILSSAAVLVSSNIAMLVVSYIGNSIGSSLTSFSAYPAVTKLDPDRISTHVNRQQGMLSLGAFASPLVMALLINTLGMGWQVCYISGIVILILIFIMVMFAKSPGRNMELRNRKVETEEEKKNRKRIILTPAFICIGLTLGIYMTMEMGILNYIKDYFVLTLDYSLGASLCISAIRGGMTLSRLFADRFIKNRIYLTIGTVLLSAVIILCWAFLKVPLIALILCLVFGIIAGPCWPTAMSMGLSLDPSSSGKLSSILTIYNNVGNNLGSILMGVIVDNLGMKNGFIIDSFIAVLVGIVTFIAVRDFRRRGYTPEGEEWVQSKV